METAEEKALSVFLSKLFKQKIAVFSSVANYTRFKTPAFFDHEGQLLTAGDLIVAFRAANGLSKCVKYVTFDSLKELAFFNIFFVESKIDTSLWIANDILNCLVEQINWEKVETRGRYFARLWKSKNFLILEVNDHLYLSKFSLEWLIVMKEANLRDVKLEVLLGNLELTLEEYESLKPGSKIKISNFLELECLLKAADVELGKGIIELTEDGANLKISRLDKSIFFNDL